jgi:hypothetical protein
VNLMAWTMGSTVFGRQVLPQKNKRHVVERSSKGGVNKGS